MTPDPIRRLSPIDRTRALNAAAVHLHWLLDRRHRRLQVARTLLRGDRLRSELADATRDSGGRRPAGTHSDPTARAALAATPTVADSRHLATIDDATARVIDCASFVRRTLQEPAAPPRASTLAHAARDVAWALTAPHSVSTWAPPDDETRNEVDHAIDMAATDLAIITGLVRTVLAGATHERPTITQPRRIACVSCARFGLDVDVDGRYRRRCRRCGDFLAAHGAPPTERICRTWHAGIDRITPGMILDAQAANTSNRRGA